MSGPIEVLDHQDGESRIQWAISASTMYQPHPNGSSIEEMETTMELKFTVALEFDEKDQIDAAELTDQIDDAVSDRVDGWYSVNVEHIRTGPSKFVADDDYIAMVMNHLIRVNPNADGPDYQEHWDNGAVDDLANYLKATDHIEIDLVNISNLYEMYDLLKWTRANNS